MNNSYVSLCSTPSGNQSAQLRKILNSWKEIASYTGRGVRTVQRYEAQLGFPVHRPAGNARSAVLAFSDEVEAWLRRTPVQGSKPGNVIEIPLNTSSREIGDQDADACPFCHGTGKARHTFSIMQPIPNSKSDSSDIGRRSGIRLRRSAVRSQTSDSGNQ